MCLDILRFFLSIFQCQSHEKQPNTLAQQRWNKCLPAPATSHEPSDQHEHGRHPTSSSAARFLMTPSDNLWLLILIRCLLLNGIQFFPTGLKVTLKRLLELESGAEVVKNKHILLSNKKKEHLCCQIQLPGALQNSQFWFQLGPSAGARSANAAARLQRPQSDQTWVVFSFFTVFQWLIPMWIHVNLLCLNECLWQKDRNIIIKQQHTVSPSKTFMVPRRPAFASAAASHGAFAVDLLLLPWRPFFQDIWYQWTTSGSLAN